MAEPTILSSGKDSNDSSSGGEVTVFRDRSVSYLELPATDPAGMPTSTKRCSDGRSAARTAAASLMGLDT